MPNFVFAFDLSGGNYAPAVYELPVADSQTLVVGDAVVLSSGKLAKASTTFGSCVGVMAEAITTGSSAGGPLAKVYIVTPGQVWIATASADATTHVLAAATYDLNSSQVVNVADTTGGSIQILKLGTSTTQVYIQFTVCALA